MSSAASAQKPKRGGKEKKEIAGFLLKLYDICCNNDLKKIIDYGPTGETIVVKNVEKFTEEVLPCYFRHNKYQSFVRQLNMYDFHKTMANPKDGEFKHRFFLKGRMDLLPMIKRKEKKEKPNMSDDDDDEEDGGGGNGDVNEDVDSFFDDTPSLSSSIPSISASGNASRQLSLQSLSPPTPFGLPLGDQKHAIKLDKISICNELRMQRTVTDQVIQQISEMEADNSLLKYDNNYLNQQILENQKKQEQIHKRLDSVLKALYLIQYANISAQPSDSGRPAKLIQNIITTGSIPSKLGDKEVKWIEDYANSLVKNANQLDPSPRSPRLFEDDGLGGDVDMYSRMGSFDEMIKDMPGGTGFVLQKSHSLYDDSLNEESYAAKAGFYYPNYNNPYATAGLYGGHGMPNGLGLGVGLGVGMASFSDPSMYGGYGGPGMMGGNPIREAIMSDKPDAPRRVGRPRKNPLPGSVDHGSSFPSVTTVEKLSTGTGKRGRPPKINNDNNSVNSSVSSEVSSKRGKSNIESDGESTLDNDDPSWQKDKTPAEKVEALKRNAEKTLDRVNSIESTFLSVAHSGASSQDPDFQFIDEASNAKIARSPVDINRSNSTVDV